MNDPVNEGMEKLLALSQNVLKLSRNTLVINLRFMDTAISRLSWVDFPGTLAVNGEHILYNPVYLLSKYAKEKEFGPRAYLHMVMHCVFRHSFVSSMIDMEKWDLACDIAVENMINELNLPGLAVSKEMRRRTEIMNLLGRVGMITAEKLYSFFQEDILTDSEFEKLQQLFRVDDHTVWYMPSEIEAQIEGDSSEDGGSPSSSKGSSDDGNTGMTGNADARAALMEDWKNIGEKMELDLESFSKSRGDQAGSMLQNLKEVNREKYDYTAFLKKFAVMGETMKINDDEFDYIFYTYGLQMFPEKRMPLIEPLEYKDVKRIREFVIAIDTSGSVAGEQVQTFLQKTYNILKSTESFFSRINLHVIQCDAEIQEDVKITNQEEFDEYLKKMQIKGLGGTDFRPVFERVNEMIDVGEFQNLKGLIYFTDGYGTFPMQMPAYKTAFVFVEEGFEIPDVPPWAIKLILRKEEI